MNASPVWHCLLGSMLLRAVIVALFSIATPVQGHAPGEHLLEPPDTSKELGKYDAFAAARRFQLDNASLMPGAPELPGLLVGRVRVPVILVCFPETLELDKVSPTLVNDRFFGNDDPTARSVKRYLSEVSHGRIDLSGTVTPWITMPKAANQYLVGGYLNREFFETLAMKLPNYLVMNDFDCDDLELDAPPKRDDNEVDGPVILLASELKGMSGQSGNLTAYRSWIEWTSNNGWDPRSNRGPILCDGVKLSSYCVSSVFKHKRLFHDPMRRQLFDIGTVAHEVLHIYGLPDLYIGQQGKGVGAWCAMGWGIYGKDGDGASTEETSPMLLSPLARGWINPDMGAVAENEGIYPCEPASHRGKFWRIPVDKNDPKRALLVELRNAAVPADESQPPHAGEWDRQIVVPGFLIWEVDEGVGLVGNIRRNQMFSGNRWLIRVVQQDMPNANEMPNVSISPSDLWTTVEQSYRHPASGIVLAGFDVQAGQFTVRHPGSVPGAPAPAMVEAKEAASGAMSDGHFLQSLDASLSRLAKMSVETIDTEPGLKHRDALRNLHRGLQGRQEAIVAAGEVSLKPNEVPATHAESQLAEIEPAYREKFEVMGTLREDSETFSSLKNLTLPKDGELNENLNKQWVRLQQKLGSPASVEWLSQVRANEEVTVANSTGAAATKVRFSEVLRRPTIKTKDGKNLSIFGAELLSKANADGSADHEWIAAIKPAKLEELADALRERTTEVTREAVEEYGHRNFKLGTQLRGDDWKFRQGYDAGDGRETWQVEIPLVSGRGSLVIDVAGNKQTKALEIVRPPR